MALFLGIQGDRRWVDSLYRTCWYAEAAGIRSPTPRWAVTEPADPKRRPCESERRAFVLSPVHEIHGCDTARAGHRQSETRHSCRKQRSKAISAQRSRRSSLDEYYKKRA